MSALPARLRDALRPDHWARANRELVAKLLTELAYEEVLSPRPVARADGEQWTTYVGVSERFEVDLGPRLTLAYAATLRSFGVWRVDPGSITATLDGASVPLPDAADVIAHGAPAIGASAETTAGLIAEVTATLLSDVVQLAHGRPARELLDLDPAQLDGQLRGHPWIIASKGRLGFSPVDVDAYAPESGRTVRLAWLAAQRERVELRTEGALTIEQVVREQVGDDGWHELRARARERGADPDQVVFLPVHPWQLREKITALHAAELARGELLALGELDREYVPQLSIRTLSDAADPARRDVKLPLSILNTSTYRGLPRAATLAAPALTAWLRERIDGDRFLAPRLELLGEVAAVSIASAPMDAIDGVPYQLTEQLGALWREPIAPRLRDGEHAITLAALLHEDPAGESLLAELVARSRLSAGDWLARLHEVVLPPLLHTLYRYGITFSPHGQNCLVILDAQWRPVRLAVKDFADDAIITADPLPELMSLPAEVRAALGDGVASMIASQWIQSGLLVCVYRYLAELGDRHLGVDEGTFWELAASAVIEYQEAFAAELGDRFALFDFAAPAFVKLCLNRVRILGRGYANDPERPIAAAVGVVENPLAQAAAALTDAAALQPGPGAGA